MSEIPKPLIQNIKSRNIVLFLGSGFSYNAIHPKNKQTPLGNDLSNLIANKFLGGEYNNHPLTFVADLAISEFDLFTVQNYIAEIFEPFSPNESQILLSSFSWKAIFTTNYDLIVEKSYAQNKENLVQSLSKVYRNTPEQQIFKTPNSLPYYKLHGCIENINDADLPLILSTEQYISHLNNRDRLFLKLEELGQDYPILFIGYNNQDFNIRSILAKLDQLKDGRPRSFMIGPNFSATEIRYWEGRKITCVPLGYEEFIKLIDSQITEREKKLSVFRTEVEKPIFNKFQLKIEDLRPTESLMRFLDFESEYVHQSMICGNTTPQAFFKGFFNNWDPIIRNFDIERNKQNRILTDLVLEDKYQEEGKSYVFVVKGYAGSGKSVLLKRLAWETAIEFNKLCLFIKPNTSLRVEPILELYNFVKERIYIFIDNAVQNENGIIELSSQALKDSVPITIITTERINVWNDRASLAKYISEDYTLQYLQENEIELILNKLEIHDSLGYLKNKTKKERKNELAEISGRVLLVALYEATGGKPFEEIIFDEYNSITSEDAKSLYITISVFHRLGYEVRAGLISRVHKISFEMFKEKLFSPLEFIVFSEKNYFINDYTYKTRHPYIAQIIFELVLNTEQSRYDEYIRIISSLDIDYKSDRYAFLEITNARKLLELFKDPQRIRNIYDLAETKSPEDPKLIQQRAIFEMNSSGGSLVSAEKFLKRANSLSPNDPTISHSLAEASIKNAEASENEVEKNQYLDIAKSLCHKIIRSYKDQPHAYHSLLKISIIKFKSQIKNETDIAIENRIKEIEKLLTDANQLFPDQEFIIDIEAKFHETIDNAPKAIELLQKAYKMNKASPYISLRYAKILEKQNDLPKAIKVLKSTLDLNPNNRDVNFKYANLLSIENPTNYTDIIHYYRRSFTLGDSRYEAQFWYARALYLNDQIPKAKEGFKELSRARVAPKLKNLARGIVNSNNDILYFKGSIIRHESNFAFLKRDRLGDEIFLHKDPKINNWEEFTIGKQITFNIAFNYKGPIAICPILE